ncbi:MAG: hypothetical protein ACOYL3_15600 [Desulfuromonadaceae bacterium]
MISDIFSNIYKQLSAHYNKHNRYKQCLFDTIKLDPHSTILSTAEHIAPFNSFSTISYLYPILMLQEAGIIPRTNIAILAGSLIPLDNTDYPRGFVLPYASANKANLFSNKYLKCSPVLLRPTSMTEQLNELLRRYPFLESIFKAQYENYAEQMAVAMVQIAQQWFKQSGTIHVYSIENVAKAILIKLLKSDDIIVNKLLFDKKVRSCLHSKLFNVFCAWGKARGSFLFWARDSKCKLVRLEMSTDGLFLQSCNHDINLRLDKNTLLEMLESKAIWPSAYLSLFITSYLSEIPVAGGRKQYHYYRHMIEATNGVLGQDRTLELSVFGYDRMKYAQNDIVPDYGAGLHFATNYYETSDVINLFNTFEANDTIDCYYD